jgi:hypothetical protein
VLASLAAARTGALVDAGGEPKAALAAGYHLAFLIGAVFAAAGGLLGAARFTKVAAPAEGPAAHAA